MYFLALKFQAIYQSLPGFIKEGLSVVLLSEKNDTWRLSE